MIHESNHEEFGVVRDKLNSIFDIISIQTSMRPMMQYVLSISTEPRDRKVQVPSTAIDVGNEEVHQFL